jgi:hypothetical protein
LIGEECPHGRSADLPGARLLPIISTARIMQPFSKTMNRAKNLANAFAEASRAEQIQDLS